MHSSKIFSAKCFCIAVAAIAIIIAACNKSESPANARSFASPRDATSAQTTSPNAPLSANDVSILFPAPTTAADFANLIAVKDLTAPNPQDPTKRSPVWPDDAFQQFIANAASPAAQIAGSSDRIGLPIEAQVIDAWFIAGIRIDAGAPGLSSDIRNQLGNLPEIRLIIQPVVRNPDGTPKVFDIAGHLIYDFIATTPLPPAQTDCFPRQQPDPIAFASVVADAAALRNKLANGQLGANKVSTANVPLGVHPGLADPTTTANFRNEIKSFLQAHIAGPRLDSMAIAGLPGNAPAPWIFLSMLKVPPGLIPVLPNGGFVPVHGPTLDGDQQFAEALEPAGKLPRVVPDPHANNLNPISCKSAAVSVTSLPVASRSGVSTAELFAATPPAADRINLVLNTIADPTKSHFFNTDCVSCHTETRRAMDLQKITAIPGIDPAALPGGQWNIRNFGWSPDDRPTRATVTRRTANETAAVVSAINAQLQAKPQP
jgi:hypothetical protein